MEETQHLLVNENKSYIENDDDVESQSSEEFVKIDPNSTHKIPSHENEESQNDLQDGTQDFTEIKKISLERESNLRKTFIFIIIELIMEVRLFISKY